MNRLFVTLTVALIVAALGQHTSAQTLTSSLMQRYLEALREQAGIPGMSGLVLQNGVEVWKGGFGRADVESGIPATPDTPYPIGGLSQTIGATLLLKECVDENTAHPNDPMVRWSPGFPEASTTLGQLLAHISPSGAFSYDLARFAALTPAIERCSGTPYPELLVDEIFTHLGMMRSVPGSALAVPTPSDVEAFGALNLARYRAVLDEMAVPYRVAERRAIRTDVRPARVNAATGIVSTVNDLARFNAALTPRDPRLLNRETLLAAWGAAAAGSPAGFGWFVQTYNGELVVWQFGAVPDAYSALLVRVPERGLTFILLANSDALAAPFARETWNVTASVFARAFLLIYVP